MNIQTNISNAGFYFILIVAAAIALAYVIYFFKKDKDEFIPYQRYLLAGIKFLAVFLVTLLLLSPLLETIKNRIEKPILIVGIDNSESMLADSTNRRIIDQFIKKASTDLSDKFSVETFTFGEKLTKTSQANFTEQKSNYANLFTELDKRFYNLNVGAMVLLGDGIYNEGKNPGQDNFRLEAPVYTIGFGDTISQMDQAIVDVTHNPNVFLDNEFPLEVQVNFTEFPQSQTQLSIYLDGRLMKSENIDVLQANFFYQKTFELKAEKAGLRSIEVVVSPILAEQNKRNNRFRFSIEVHDNKKKILILSQGPHPDIGAIMQTLTNQANFTIKSQEVSAFNGKLSDYDLIVLNQLPSLRTQHLPIFDDIQGSGVSTLVLVGPSTSIAGLNNLNLKFQLNPTLITEESTPYFNEAFSLFSLPGNIKDVEHIYPPLLTHFTEYEIAGEYSVLAYQKINGIEMNYPLLMAGSIAGRKIGAIMGEGIWRWRFYEYQNYDNQNAFNMIVVNLFNYLCVSEEREQFRIYYDRIVPETSPVKLKAQVFNEIYEPINTAEVKLSLTDSSGNELSYLFDSNELEYNLNMGFSKPGNYQFEARTFIGEKEFIKKGNFSVEEVNIEQQKLQSDFNMLHLISAQTGGKFYQSSNYTQLIEQLNADNSIQTKVHTENNIHELIDWKWFIFLLIVLFSLEWFLRKFWGSY
ncbi:MAG: hypothetical protein ACERKD_11525 [Prolixibacteraceae bacterium]